MDPEELKKLMAGFGQLNEQMAPILARLNAQANTVPAPAAPTPITQGIDSQAGAPIPSSRVMSADDMLSMRRTLKDRTTAELHMLFSEQASKSGTGVPLQLWLAAGGNARLAAFNQQFQASVDPGIMRALDTSGAAALIRQDLEPILYELYIRTFPAWDRIAKEPANGLTHTFQRITSFGDAQFMPELGTVTDDRSAYERDTTNVAVIATRRGVSLKSQFATVQSGSGFNPEQLELTGGLRALAHRMQKQIFSGHSTDSGGTSSNELGAYDVNAFTGLRSTLNTSRAQNVQIDQDNALDLVRNAVDNACVEIMQVGPGTPTVAMVSPIEHARYNQSQDKLVRYPGDRINIAPGVTTNGINTVFGVIPLMSIPGDAIGAYTSSQYSNNEVRDLYLLDESSITMPYLGSEGPTVLEIPIGVSGQLTKLFIIFGMWGLAVKAPTFSNKVRIRTALG